MARQEQRQCKLRLRKHPASLALVLLLSFASSPVQAQTLVHTSQRATLDALKLALPSTVCPQLWSYSCSGRKLCDSSNNIINMNWGSCGLSGAVPSQISGLSTLTALNAQNNQLTGIASQFTALTRLVNLNLMNNQLSGSIPPWLVSLARVADLNLANNKFSGPLPATYSATLSSINLSSNSLTGDLPDGISSLTRLASLQLQNNQLTGSLPASYGSTPLITLNLANNKISSLGNLGDHPRLQNVYAGNNLLTSLPDVGLGNIRNLYLQGNQMSGGIPASWSNLDSVHYIDISGNQLSGQIPDFVFSYASLNELNVAGNFFYGTIPATACSNDVYPFIFSGNCFSYAGDFPCQGEGMKDGPTCEAFCGAECVPVLPGVDLTSAPLGGCLQCSSQGIGYLFDSSSGQVVYQDQEFPASSKGSGSRNIQKYLTVGPTGSGSIVGTSAAQDWESCCSDCAAAEGCSFWHFYPPENGAVPSSQGGQSGVFCYFLSLNPPQALLPALQLVDTTIPLSHVGGKCNPAAEVVDDPHFIGARGTRFDFSGELGRSFCLLSDAALHINVLLKGYLDTRLEQATKIVNGKAVRSWIKGAAVLWRSPSGTSVSIKLAARPGVVDDSLAYSYLHQLTVNGIPAILPRVGKKVKLGNGVVLHFKGLQQKGRSPMAVYELALGSDTKLGVHLRPAHHKLQTQDDSQVHINMHLLKIKPTEDVHGILGQTFRNEEERVTRARIFSEVARILKTPVAVDGDSGRGFLDGEVKDYLTSSLTSPDCAYAHEAWNSRKVVYSD